MGGDRLPYSYRKLKGRIVEKFDTQGKFADKLGISENSLSLKMNGKTGFSQSDIIRWSELLDIAPEDYGSYFFS